MQPPSWTRDDLDWDRPNIARMYDYFLGGAHKFAVDREAAQRAATIDPELPVILQANPLAASVQGDVRQAAKILDDASVHRLLDVDKPLAVLLISILHSVPDEEAFPAVRILRDALPPGGYLALTHASADNMSPEARADLERFWESTRNLMYFRSRSQLAEFFEGLALVEPGLVHIPLWRPDSPEDLLFEEPERTSGYAGVGHSP